MGKVNISINNKSIQRINEKCIDCGTCLATCKNCNNLSDDECINCGQCILTCPVGALVPVYSYKEVYANICDEEKVVVISISPAVRVSIGDEFGFAPGEFLEKKLVGVLKDLGFDYVFDTSFGADLTTIEEANELIDRIKNNKKLPMFTSCCPSWVLNMKMNHYKDIDHLSTCKSPIGMQGSIIKNYIAKLKNINKEDIVTVSLAPCVSKKSEIENDINNDYVLTTSELSMLIREKNIDFKNIKDSEFDSILDKGSGAGVLFGTSGGVMTSALRCCYYLLNNEYPPEEFFSLENLNNASSIKEAIVDLKVMKINVAVVYGINEVNKIYDTLKKYHFVEVMTCKNGCVGGAGQPVMPINKQQAYIEERRKSLIKNDLEESVKCSYLNPNIKKIYEEFLEKPLSDKSKMYLHQEYKEKELV